ncbi:MAG: hypothetical protein FWF90_17470 [Promicromonosporaceae bacterium]|nr:hypothetical protein [Promicromonosporaceae bacterium]
MSAPAPAYASGEYPAGGDLVTTPDGIPWVVVATGPEQLVIVPVLLVDELRVARPEALSLVEREQ